MTALALTTVLAACGGPSGPAAPAGRGPDAQGKRIAIAEFATDGAVVNYPEPVATFGITMAEQVAADLRERGHAAEAFRSGQEAAGDLVVRGRYTLIDGDSRALRYWVGFGAGAAKVNVAGEVMDGAGNPVATYSAGRGSGFGFFGGSSPALVEKCNRRVADDIARMVDAGDYRMLAR